MQFRSVIRVWALIAVPWIWAVWLAELVWESTAPRILPMIGVAGALLAVVIALIATPFVEGAKSRRMLDAALRLTAATRGAPVKLPLSALQEMAREEWPAVSWPLGRRYAYVNSASRAAESAVAIPMPDGLQLRTGSGAKHLVHTIPSGRYRLMRAPGVARVEMLDDTGAAAATFGVLHLDGRRLRPATVAEAVEALALDGSAV